MKHAYAEVNAIRLHYASAGAGDLMLFVHGFPEFWYAWQSQLAEFGRDRRAVALDMRGYNLSSKPQELSAYRVKHLVEDLRALIEHLGYRRCTMVAHDWGGAIAWSFAARHPEYLERLVIINAPHPATFARELTHNPAQIRASQYMLLFRDAKAERVLSENGYARMLRMLVDAVDWLTPADRERYLEAWSQPGALTGALNYYRASPLYPGSAADPGASALGIDKASVSVSVATLVIWGERDRALLAGNLDGLEEYVSPLTIMRVPNGSHWVVHEQPGLVNRTIREFVAA